MYNWQINKALQCLMPFNPACMTLSLIFFRFPLVNNSSNHFSNASCLFGELLKPCYFVSCCIILLISQMLQHFTTHKFNLCEAQCVYNALWRFAIVQAAAPSHCPSSIINLPAKKLQWQLPFLKFAKNIISNCLPYNPRCAPVKFHKNFSWATFIKVTNTNR